MLSDELPKSKTARSISDSIFSAVRSGELSPGQQLPSIRQLAQTCGVSPTTISAALNTLRHRGVITLAPRRRARVASRPAVPQLKALPLPDGVHDVSSASPDSRLLPNLGSFLSADLWKATGYDTGLLDPTLESAMGSAFEDDGITGPLTVTNGSLDALERILITVARPGEAIVVEDPVWNSTLTLIRVLGLEPVPVAVDDSGVLPKRLDEALSSRSCAALILTPRAQNPYGSALDTERTDQLRSVLAQHPSVYVIEDDHASLVAGTAAHTVIADRDRWAVIRSANKALGPDLRLAVTASDPHTAEHLQGRFMVGPGWVSHFAQRLVGKVLADPATQRQIRTAENEYTARRNRLIGALDKAGIPAHGRSGMNVLIPVDDEAAVSSRLLLAGWGVRSGSSFRLRTPPFLRVSISQLTQPEIDDFAATAAQIILGTGGTARY